MTKHTKIKTGNMKKGEQFKLSPSSKIWTVVRKDGNNVIATMTSVSRLGKKETYIKTFPCSRYMYKITEDENNR